MSFDLGLLLASARGACFKKSFDFGFERVPEAIPIRPVPGKIRHSNLVFYFRELVKFSGTVTEHFCCPFYRNYTFIGTIVNDGRALIKYIARKTKFL